MTIIISHHFSVIVWICRWLFWTSVFFFGLPQQNTSVQNDHLRIHTMTSKKVVHSYYFLSRTSCALICFQSQHLPCYFSLLIMKKHADKINFHQASQDKPHYSYGNSFFIDKINVFLIDFPAVSHNIFSPCSGHILTSSNFLQKLFFFSININIQYFATDFSWSSVPQIT